MFVKWCRFGCEDVFWELVLSFHHVGPQDRIQVLYQTWQQVPLPTEPSHGSSFIFETRSHVTPGRPLNSSSQFFLTFDLSAATSAYGVTGLQVCVLHPVYVGLGIKHEASCMLGMSYTNGAPAPAPAQPLVDKKVLHSFTVHSLVQMLTLEVSSAVRVEPTESG